MKPLTTLQTKLQTLLPQLQAEDNGVFIKLWDPAKFNGIIGVAIDIRGHDVVIERWSPNHITEVFRANNASNKLNAVVQAYIYETSKIF